LKPWIEITRCFMRHFHDKTKILLPPHHTQLLSVLMCADFYDQRRQQEAAARPSRWWQRQRAQEDSGLGDLKTMVARVGTGEGKSIIIAMLAVYLAHFKGQKVHILVNNAGLRERDYSSMKLFYEKNFGLTTKISKCVDRELAPQGTMQDDEPVNLQQRALANMNVDMRERLERAGAQMGKINISLKWDNSPGMPPRVSDLPTAVLSCDNLS
jgi:predicted enzyme related to lactoylglutathione lyase